LIFLYTCLSSKSKVKILPGFSETVLEIRPTSWTNFRVDLVPFICFRFCSFFHIILLRTETFTDLVVDLPERKCQKCCAVRSKDLFKIETCLKRFYQFLIFFQFFYFPRKHQEKWPLYLSGLLNGIRHWMVSIQACCLSIEFWPRDGLYWLRIIVPLLLTLGKFPNSFTN